MYLNASGKKNESVSVVTQLNEKTPSHICEFLEKGWGKRRKNTK